MLRMLLAQLPSRSPATLAQRLVRRADAARDARHWVAAAALYEEALALAPHRHRIHIQAGHAWKEAGAFVQAETHYATASAALPEDADLALQIGHFYLTRSRLEEAEAAYRRALALDPGLAGAHDALARLAVAPEGEPGADGAIVAELLPDERDEPAPQRDQLLAIQLGRELSRDGAVRRVLRGIEAIRAVWLSSARIDRVDLAIDGTVIHTLRPERHGLARPLGPAQAKYVANIWHDFSACAPGEASVELRLVEADGKAAVHRVTLVVQPPSDRMDRLRSDACIPLAGPDGDAEAAVNALPSVARSARHAAPFPPPRAILVQRVDQLGDLVASEPALRRLRALFPEARLIGLVSPANVDLAQSMPWLDGVELVRFDPASGSGRPTLSAAAQDELRQRLARHDFDLAIDLGEGDASRPLLRLSGAPFLYGFRPRDFPWLSGGVETALRDPLNGHEAAHHSRRLLTLVESLAALGDTPARILQADTSMTRMPGGANRPIGGYALLHTGARLAFSRWPGFADLARLLIDRTALRVIVMHEDGDVPTLPASDRVRILSGRLPFAEFDALVSGAAILVGNDSGPKHLAALRGTPVVSVHSARINWSEWGQEGDGTIISRRVPCAGCGIAAHPEDCGKDFACIRRINPDEVFAAVQALLAAS